MNELSETVERRRIWPVRWAIAILLAGLIIAAAWAFGIGAGLDINVPGGTYAPGSSISFFLENTGWRTLEFNPCIDASLERQTGDGWKRFTFDKSCTLALLRLPRGGPIVGGFTLPDNIPPGTYRVVESTDVGLVTRDFLSNTFGVK